MSPEGHALVVVGEDEDVAARDAGALQLREAGVCEASAEAEAALVRRHGEVMQVAAPSFVTAQHSANDPTGVPRDEAEAGIALEVGGKLLRRVGLVQADTLGRGPEREHFREIGGRHR